MLKIQISLSFKEMTGGHLLSDDMNMVMMPMYFTTNLPINVLFTSWVISDTLSLTWSCLAVIGMGFLRHLLIAFRHTLAEANSPIPKRKKREQLLNQDSDDTDERVDELNESFFSRDYFLRLLSNSLLRRKQNRWVLRLIDGLIYFLTSSLGFLNMLVAMTYNPYLLVAIVLGETIGVILLEGPPSLQDAVESSEASCH